MHHPPQAAQTVLSVLLCASLLLGTCPHRCAVKHLLCDAANSVATPDPRQTCSSVPGSICQLLLYTCLLIACFSVLMVIALVMVSTLLPPATQTVTLHSAEQHVNVGAKRTALRDHSTAQHVAVGAMHTGFKSLGYLRLELQLGQTGIRRSLYSAKR